MLVCSFQRTSLYNPYSVILSLFTAALNIIVMSLVSTFWNEFQIFKYKFDLFEKSKIRGKIEDLREKTENLKMEQDFVRSNVRHCLVHIV